MKSKLTKQELKVYRYVVAHRGCTTMDIQRDLHIECPSARLTGLRKKGVNIISIGQKKYEGSRAFECYAIEDAPSVYKTEYRFDAARNVMVEVRLPAH
jgi:hypothetical protein